MVDRFVSVTETETEKVYLADLLKTNLTNSNELKKRKGEKERARRRKGEEEKLKQWLHSCFYNTYFGDSFWPKKTVRHKRSIWR